MLRTAIRLTALSAAAIAIAGPTAAADEPRADRIEMSAKASVPASFDTAFAALPATRAVPPPVPEDAVDLATIEPPIEVEPVLPPPVTRAIRGGRASFYGRRFHGRTTANGERFNMNAMTAAHRTLPFGTRVRVTNPRTGASVIVRINDRGPFHGNRVIDVSRAAAEELGMIRAGTASVQLEVLD